MTKKIIIVLMSLLLTVQANAAENKVLQTVVEEMAKQYLKSYARSASVKEMEEYAKKVLSENMATRISQTLAILDIVEGIKSYNSAKSETQRYQALSQSFVSAVMMIPAVGPAVGSLIQLGVLSQSLAAALVSKKYALDQAKLMAEISAIEKKTSDMILAEYNTEYNAFMTLYTRSEALAALISENMKLIQSQCFSSEDIMKADQCLASALLQKNLLQSQILTMSRIVNFKGRFIATAAGLSKETLEDMQTALKTAREGVQEISNTIQQNLASIIEDKLLKIREGASAKAHAYRCERLITDELMELLKTQVKMQDPEQQPLAEIYILEHKEALHELTEQTCPQAVAELSPEVQRILKENL